MSKEQQLCVRDLSVLNLLFDSSFGENKEVKDLTFHSTTADDVAVKDEDEGSSVEIATSKQLELEGVRLTECGKLEEALLKFNESIAVAAQRPSIYNNRAQLYRFLQSDDLALADLSKAIELSNDTSYPLTRCRAFCQRGIVRKKLNDENGARDDFNESAKFGSTFAKQQLVDLNPYARLCNQMVTKLLADMK